MRFRHAAAMCVVVGVGAMVVVFAGGVGAQPAGAKGGPPASAPATAPAAATPPGPLEGIRAQLASATTPFVLLVRMELKPGGEAEFAKLAAAAEKGTASEPGAIAYTFSRAAGNPRQITLYEHWRSFEDLKKHFEFGYVKDLLGRASELTTGAPEMSVHVPMHASK